MNMKNQTVKETSVELNDLTDRTSVLLPQILSTQILLIILRCYFFSITANINSAFLLQCYGCTVVCLWVDKDKCYTQNGDIHIQRQTPLAV